MAQITRGIRAILSRPFFYTLFQRIMGAHQGQVTFVDNFVKPQPGTRVLDIGCGPGDILAYLPDVEYWGFDISNEYIEQAKKRFGSLGVFHCKELTVNDVENMSLFDTVLAMGLIHHLDDESAISVLRLAKKALKPGGRLITIDPCLVMGQSPIARFLINNDRGQNVRSKEAYANLASTVFESPTVTVRHKSWIPYTHCVMECTRK